MSNENKGLSRRNFLKSAAAASAASVGATMLGACAPKQVATPEAGEAAAGCEAGYSWLTAPAPIAESEIKETIDADVVVVGAGLAGLSSALSAAENGAKVVVVEKGATWTGRGGGIGVADSRMVRDSGYELDKKKAAREWMSLCGNRAKESLVWLFLNESGNAMDWFLDKADAAKLPAIIWGGYYKGETYTEYPVYHMFMGGPMMQEGKNPAADCSYLLYNEAVKLNVQFIFEAPAEQLVKDGDRVTAVVVKTADGYKRVNAAKGVVLATGDIGGDPEMVKAYAPIVEKANPSQYTPVGVNTGDGHKMGLWAGGALQEAPFPTMIHPQAFSWLQYCFLFVNTQGNRFMSEDNWVQARSLNVMKQPGENKFAFSIFDSKWPEEVPQTLPYGGGMFWDSFRAEGTDWTPDGDTETIKTYVEGGQLGFMADTLEELAAKIGVPAETLTATVERYNELAENKDDVDFGKRAELLFPINKPPYYALKFGGALLTVVGGLSIDEKLRVLDAEQKPVPGLYAVGNASGDIYAVDYPIAIPGNSHGRALTWGYLVGKTIMEG